MNKYIKRYLITILLLLIFGSLMVFSTSWPYSFRLYGVETKIFIKHIEFVALSLMAIFVVSHINILKFKNILKKNNVNVTIRRTQGDDIDAACGQLRAKERKKEIIGGGENVSSIFL